jgi:3-oxoacyl-[acyl-carrier protein] reductase
MDLGISGRVALVGGGGGGLGSAVARTIGAEGARVAVTDIDAAAAARTVEDIVGAGGVARAFRLDSGDLDALPAVVQGVRDAFGPIEILVNNTGGPPPTSAAGIEPDVWADQFRLMVLGVIRLSDLVLPSMRDRRWGRIITSASSGVVAPIPNLGISNALRLALVGWSKTLAREVAPDGITVNIVVPGRIATQRVRALDEARAERDGLPFEDVQRSSTSTIPMQRYGRPEEYAAAVGFLASEQASYVTGSMLRIDGGLIASI